MVFCIIPLHNTLRVYTPQLYFVFISFTMKSIFLLNLINFLVLSTTFFWGEFLRITMLFAYGYVFLLLTCISLVSCISFTTVFEYATLNWITILVLIDNEFFCLNPNLSYYLTYLTYLTLSLLYLQYLLNLFLENLF